MLLCTLALSFTYQRATGHVNEADHRFTDRASEIRYLLAKYRLDAEWIRVAKLEAGTDLNSNVARQAQNYFGLHRAYSRPTTSHCGYGMYACYASADDNVRDLVYWAQMGTQRQDESFDRWLKRRGWNPLPTYWRTLAGVPM